MKKDQLKNKPSKKKKRLYAKPKLREEEAFEREALYSACSGVGACEGQFTIGS